ncbi:tRNA pseudouridine(55) synthase TruB [Bombilactobacillus bombi]|uniref:tRNA pseudouridine(55) synthase TruB n=1 Tax=Bombilactobacillus bombi TaxID=1303590 RepID=UPI0015E5C41C|nr:tRNA pseudouridine(55) synthase TruB [Bombilactobacillus bombi]MBA1435023.1 tRNA pseudouridine(55) synthase TruB [Bombilactobacillus bombi]
MNGIIPLYKPRGMTSADCVYQLRKILHEKKIGHTGTLDPEVDGVLVICVGQATKLVNLLMQKPKTYQGQITLGVATTTEDATGEIIQQTKLLQPFTTEQIVQTMQSLCGTIQQTPPLYSAVRVNGKHLYEYARAHQNVERPTRTVEIYRFELKNHPCWLQEAGQQIIDFTVQCSKGTYIRTLAVQLGEQLQVPAHMSQLTRITGGGFELANTVSLEQIKVQVDAAQSDFLLPISTIFHHLQRYNLNTEQWQQVQNGQKLTLPSIKAQQVALYYKDILKAIYNYHSNSYEPQLMLLKNDR